MGLIVVAERGKASLAPAPGNALSTDSVGVRGRCSADREQRRDEIGGSVQLVDVPDRAGILAS